jgi:hypothetical protein
MENYTSTLRLPNGPLDVEWEGVGVDSWSTSESKLSKVEIHRGIRYPTTIMTASNSLEIVVLIFVSRLKDMQIKSSITMKFFNL